MRANIYVDAFNVYYGCLKGTSCKWLDYRCAVLSAVPRDEIHRIRYFTARVRPRLDDPEQPQRQQAYLRALETIPHLTVHHGRYLTHKTRMPLARPRPGVKTVEVIKTEEEGSDVNLASYLLLDTFRKDCEVAIVISNDSDLKEPIELAQNELGMTVGVVNPHPASRRSRALRPTFFKQLRPTTLSACQFPVQMRDARGVIHKPASW
ncbi:MAG: NYN domain-containing protein [Actinomycetota bacterium]|nr:NYN domain-containing protein [Actinomycetota bacterium]